MPADRTMLETGSKGEGSSLQALLMRLMGFDDKYLRLERKHNINQEFEKKNKSGNDVRTKKNRSYAFQMPLHYPGFSKADYLEMPEWKLDCLLKEYGLPVCGDIEKKRENAIGTFLWPDQLQ